MKGKAVLAIASLGLVLLLALSTAASATTTPRLSGAIFTTLEDGTRVNANIYDDKRDVYLDGGPGPNAPQYAAGLPDGNYYFQVTDPSGKVLLSSDPVICREFRVEGGVIVEYVSQTRTYLFHGGDVPCWVDGKENGKHDLGSDVDHGALTIQLMPYDDTPNKGGVYKVWATPTSQFVGDPEKVNNPCGVGCRHGFMSSESKTDNFKAQFKGKFIVPLITVRKFVDVNGNGLWDAGEPEIGVAEFVDGGGWPVSVTDPAGATSYGYTPYVAYALSAGAYQVSEDDILDWTHTAAILDGTPLGALSTVTVQVSYISGETHEVDFGNFECFSVDGYKYNDMNGNGTWDDGDIGLPSWTIELWRDNVLFATTTTDSLGHYSFRVCQGGDYEVREVVPDGWTATSQTSWQFAGLSGTDVSFDFFNFQWFSVSGHKYNDMNANGILDDGDVGIPGWGIYLHQGDAQVGATTTDSDGYYEFTVKSPGTYTIVEESQEGWIAVAPESGQYTFTAASGQPQTFDFFNFKLGEICGHKWYDTDMDGVRDDNEPFVQGFKIQLYRDGTLTDTKFTDENGDYCFTDLPWGTYTVKEVMPNDPDDYHAWAQTYPSEGTWTVVMTSGLEKTDADFGNVVVFTESRTWGYWKTHTGFDSPPRDDAYDLLPGNPMPVDVTTPDGNKYIDTDAEAHWLFDGGAGDINCSGDCRTLFRAQLLALHMNLLKFSGMGGHVYIYAGDTHSGDTVQQIYDDAIALLTDGETNDFTSFQETLDHINNNETTNVLVMQNPPPVVYP